MNRLKKRIFCGIISLAMFMSIVPTQAFAVKWVTTKTTNDGSIELPYSINDIDYGVEIKIGDYFVFGKYYDEPILWRCIDIDENGPLMLSDKILSLKAFDAKGSNSGDNNDSSHTRGTNSYHKRQNRGSNFWADSNIRDWLNSTADAGKVYFSCGNMPHDEGVYNGLNSYENESGFLSADNFSAQELKYIKQITQEVALNELDAEYATSGTTYHMQDPDIKNCVQNYNTTAYTMETTDRMFFLNCAQLYQLYCNFKDEGTQYWLAYPTQAAIDHSEYKGQNLSTDKVWFYWLRDAHGDGGSPTHPRHVGESGVYFSWAYNDLQVGIRPAFYLNINNVSNEDEIGPEELKEEYVSQHIDYYQSSYDEEIVSMLSTDGLGFLLEDAEGDFSDLVYSAISVVVADLETIKDFMDITSYVDINWGEGKIFKIKIPDVALMDLRSSEYSVMLYQLMASDDVYNGILDTFSVNYEKNIKKFAELISDSSLDLVKDANAAGWDDASKLLKSATDTICTADPNSVEFEIAYVNLEQIANRYFDFNKTKSYLKSISTSADNAFSFFGAALDEVDSIGKAYQYICWAESYAETSKAFKDVLKDVAIEADKMADDLYHTHSPEDLANPYSAINRYKGLSKAIDSFITTMDSYAKDAHTSFVKEVIDKTGESCLDLVAEFVSDKADKALGGSICPPLAAINKVFSSGKLLIDLFTNIDDEHKMILTVKSYEMLTALLLKVSNRYGDNMLMEEYIDPSDIFMQPVPVTLDMKFSSAIRFDEAIKMYKNAMSLACDYGIKYEKSRLAYASNMANQTVPDWWYEAGATSEWQIQASTSSTAITLLAYQKNYIRDIHCHDDGLVYDHATGTITYNGACKVITAACPVDVTVTAPDGTQLAYMSDGTSVVSDGYEPYFYIVPSSANKDDYIKVAVIPDDENYQVSIDGTGNGSMSIFIAMYNGENYSEFKKSMACEMFANYGVTDNTTGYIDRGDEENPLGYLVLDNEIYGTDCFIITFDANGGGLTDNCLKAQTNKIGQLLSLPSNPTHVNGYYFDGWYTAPIGGVLITSNYVFNSDTTVYAHWVNDSISEKPSVPVTGIKLSTQKINLNRAGDAYQIEADVTPINATNKAVMWASSNPGVASVTQAGLVTAVSNGVTTITATTQDGGYTDNCEVRVELPETPNVPVTDIELNTQRITLSRIGTSYQLKADVMPGNATNQLVTWASSNPSVATVSNNGLVTAVSEGTATITVTTEDGQKVATCTVTVRIESTSGGTGGGGSNGSTTPTSYTITSKDTVGGAITISPKTSSKGQTVTITAVPDDGFTLETLSVSDKNGNRIELTKKSETSYTFKMPASQVTVSATFTEIVVEPEPVVLPFDDISQSAWYYGAVEYVYSNDMMQGTSATTFSPEVEMGRGMIATVLYRLENKPAHTGSTSFSDVGVNEWYTDAIQWAAENGIMNGYGNNQFGPMDSVTREQLALILYNYTASKGISVTTAGDLSSFRDAQNTSDWAEEAISWAVGVGLLSGKGNGILDPTGTATRAEVAQILMNYCTKVV